MLWKSFREVLPRPLRRRLRQLLDHIERCLRRLPIELLGPKLQQSLPILRRRLKILPGDKISIITTCGNRLEYLEQSLDTYLSQTRENFDIIASVYADRQGSARFLTERYRQFLLNGKLKIVETDAEVFNKALAVNIASLQSDSEYLFLIDCDCAFSSVNALEQIVRCFNLSRCFLASFSSWGQILVHRKTFIDLGGYDGSLSDRWAPEDFDFIARYVACYSQTYVFFAPEYTFVIKSKRAGFQVRRVGTRRDVWINHQGERGREFSHQGFLDTKFYFRIGGMKETKEDLFLSTLTYFQDHSPRIDFATSRRLLGLERERA